MYLYPVKVTQTQHKGCDGIDLVDRVVAEFYIVNKEGVCGIVYGKFAEGNDGSFSGAALKSCK